jgi:ATP-dependent DNA helicase RecQ
MRGLATSTIEGHLLEFIKSGEIAIEKFVEPEKIKVISEAVESTGLEKLSAIKATLGDNYSYHEIRAVLYSLKKDQRQ